MARLEYLDEKNEEYDAESWADNSALYSGGKKFRNRIDRFLPKNSDEPNQIWRRRKEEAPYRPYAGSVVDYYAAWLFSSSFTVRARDGATGEPVESIDDFYAQWKEDVGEECDITSFLRERFTTCLTQGKAYWLVDFPGDGGVRSTDKADFEKRGLGNATLRRVDREQVYDWEIDEDDHEFLWVVIHDLKRVRPDPRAGKRSVFVETWKIYDRTFVETYRIEYEKGKRPQPVTNVEPVERRAHGGIDKVPIVEMAVPDGLCVVERVKEAQLANFRMGAALDWGIKRTCYAMPVYKLLDDQKPPTMGAGYYIMIGASESVEWVAPPTGHLTVTANERDASREEIYRITHQMSLAVNNSKAAAVGRSGESKEQDALSTRVMLNAFGSVIKHALEETYEVLSDGRGDVDISFSVEGLDSFDTESVAALLANASQANLLGIPSQTFQKEIKTRAALSMVPDADQTVKDAIRKEIDEGVEAEGEISDLLQEAEREAAATGAIPGPPADAAPVKPVPPMAKSAAA